MSQVSKFRRLIIKLGEVFRALVTVKGVRFREPESRHGKKKEARGHAPHPDPKPHQCASACLSNLPKCTISSIMSSERSPDECFRFIGQACVDLAWRAVVFIEALSLLFVPFSSLSNR